jgi:hypothetical protein
MDMEFSELEKLSAEELLAVSEHMLARTAIVLARTVGRLDAAEVVDATVASSVADRFATAFQRVMNERDKVGKLRNQTSGTVGGRSLDFDAARIEIGRRLACLRDGGAG